MLQEMNQFIRIEYLIAIKQKYQKAEKSEKGKILDEIVADSDMNRKSVIRLLNQKHKEKNEGRANGRKRKYDDPFLLLYVKKISEVTNHLCSKGLKTALVSFLPFYEYEYGILPEYIRELIIKVSPRTLDRIFAKHFPQR
jgi:hypothetical protein